MRHTVGNTDIYCHLYADEYADQHSYGDGNLNTVGDSYEHRNPFTDSHLRAW
jgi:hypothetical protein